MGALFQNIIKLLQIFSSVVSNMTMMKRYHYKNNQLLLFILIIKCIVSINISLPFFIIINLLIKIPILA